MLNPFLEILTALKITYSVKLTQSKTYYDHYITHFGPLPSGKYGQALQVGGRLVPQSTYKGNTTAWVKTIRYIRDLGVINLYFVVLDVSRFADYEKNGVVPAVSVFRALLLSEYCKRMCRRKMMLVSCCFFFFC